MHREPSACRVHRYARCVFARSDRFVQRHAETLVEPSNGGFEFTEFKIDALGRTGRNWWKNSEQDRVGTISVRRQSDELSGLLTAQFGEVAFELARFT